MYSIHQWLVEHMLVAAAGGFGATILAVTLYTYIFDRKRLSPPDRLEEEEQPVDGIGRSEPGRLGGRRCSREPPA